MKRYCVWICLCLVMGCHKAEKPKHPPPTFPVRVTRVIQKDQPIFIDTLGHVQSITSIDIRSRIEGELTGVYFTQGQEVKQGDLLFTIDPLPYEAALKESQGTLNETLANLALAEEKVKRYRILANDEYYSQIDYETLQTNFAALKAQAEQNQGAVDHAAINLDYCWIYAPINGLTGILQIDYGNLVSADGPTPLITLNQMDPIFVTFSVPEFQLARILKAKRPEAPLNVFSVYEDFETETPFEGSLFMIDNAVDQKTGMIKLRAQFNNEQRRLWPGQFVRTRLILSIQKEALLIPFSAVQMTESDPIVFIVKSDMTIDQRTVKLGQRADDLVVVSSGVQPNEQIVLEGQINLYQGAHVSIPEANR